MALMILMESAAQGVLVVNGQFCGPLEAGGQAFPAARNAEIYIQLFPFSPEQAPLTVAMEIRDGAVVRLEPKAHAYALHWPDDVIELELRPMGLPPDASAAKAACPAQGTGLLLRWLQMHLAGEAQAGAFLAPGTAAPGLSGYMAAVPLAYVPAAVREGCDERAGLVRRTADNMAVVDAALARTAAVQGRRLLGQIRILRTGT